MLLDFLEARRQSVLGLVGAMPYEAIDEHAVPVRLDAAGHARAPGVHGASVVGVGASWARTSATRRPTATSARCSRCRRGWATSSCQRCTRPRPTGRAIVEAADLSDRAALGGSVRRLRRSRRPWAGSCSTCSASTRPTSATSTSSPSSRPTRPASAPSVPGGGSDRDEEAGVAPRRGGAPARQGQVEREAGGGQVGEEVVERVAAARAEADDEPTLGRQVGLDPRQYVDARARCQEAHDVAGGEDQVERLRDADGRQVEQGQVRDVPVSPGEVRLRVVDERRVDVGADDRVAQLREPTAHASGTAPGIEDPRPSRGHRVDHPRLAVQVLPFGRQPSPPCGVAVRVLRVGGDRTGPCAGFNHEG